MGYAVAQLVEALGYWVAREKVMGLIPDGVIGIFHWLSPSKRTMALGLTQPTTEIRTGDISWGVNVPNV